MNDDECNLYVETFEMTWVGMKYLIYVGDAAKVIMGQFLYDCISHQEKYAIAVNGHVLQYGPFTPKDLEEYV